MRQNLLDTQLADLAITDQNAFYVSSFTARGLAFKFNAVFAKLVQLSVLEELQLQSAVLPAVSTGLTAA